MPEPDDPPMSPNDDDTEDPRLPPQVLLSKSTRRMAFRAYILTLVAFFAILAIAALSWWARQSRAVVSLNPETQAVDTTGVLLRPLNYREKGSAPPTRFSTTQDEVHRRGGTLVLRTPSSG